MGASQPCLVRQTQPALLVMRFGPCKTPGMIQAQLLRSEGVAVSEDLRINLENFLWSGLHWLEVDDLIGKSG